MTIRPELLDELLKDYQTPQDLCGENGRIQQLPTGRMERCLPAERQDHLGDPKPGRKKQESANTRHGQGQKTLKSEHGELEMSVPRDRDGSFEPMLVKKRQSRLGGLEEKILARDARGMTPRDIQAQLQELDGVEVWPTFLSHVTEEVMDEVRQWQNRPLEALYPILDVDCLVVKGRENQRVSNTAVDLALGVTMEGQKELVGRWMSENEGAKFWLSVFPELQNRGMKECFMAGVDGLTGLPEAIEAVLPQTRGHVCLVHLGRNSLECVSDKQRKAVAADLKASSSAATEAEAEFN